MPINQKILSLCFKRGGLNILILLAVATLIGASLIFEFGLPAAEADSEVFGQNSDLPQLSIIQNNSLLQVSNLFVPEDNLAIIGQVPVIITAYSSTTWETDDSPHLTASGTWVREGIVANNMLPFGTKIKIPEIYGDKVFVVEDRMNSRKGDYHVDIWFSSFEEALIFGAKRTYIEILES